MLTYFTYIVVFTLPLLGGFFLWRWKRGKERKPQAPWPIPEPRQHAIILAHGILGFDHFKVAGTTQHYFRGVADHLRAQGAVVHSTRVSPLGTVPERAAALESFINEIDERRIILVGHSMGGLDARYAVSQGNIQERVSALIAVATPHQGTVLANAASSLPGRMLRSLLGTVGMSTDALDWLEETSADGFNTEVSDVPGVFYGCIVGKTSRRQVLGNPVLMASFELLTRLRGDNDGMVPLASQYWGRLLQSVHTHHFGEIGWAPHFDANAMYLQLLYDLQETGITCLPKERASSVRKIA